MSFEDLELHLPQERDITLPSPFKRILNQTSEFQANDEEFSQSLYVEQRKRIKMLEYEVSNLKNQTVLNKLDRDKESSDHQKEIKLKDEEISNLSSNEKFLFEQNEELKSKISQLQSSNRKHVEQKDEEISKLRKSVSLKQDELTELRYELKSQTSKSDIIKDELTMKVDQLESHVADLEENLDDQIEVNNKSVEKIRALEDQIESLQSSRTTGTAEDDGHTELLYKKQFNSQIEYIAQLQEKIESYESSLNKLGKSNQLVEVLKEERNSFLKKIENLKVVEEQYDDLKVKYEVLSHELEKWTTLSESEESPLEFINRVKLMNDENKSLKEKTIKLTGELSEISDQKSNLLLQLEHSKMEIDDVNKNVQDLRLLILKTTNSKKLLEQEITFMKNQIEFLRVENKMLLSGRNRRLSSGAEPEQEPDYVDVLSDKQKIIDELSNLVSHYKNELNNSTENFKVASSPVLGEKRRKIFEGKSTCGGNHVEELTAMKLEVEAKEREISILKENIKSLKQEVSVRSKVSNQQAITNHSGALECNNLKKENEQLLSQLQQNGKFDVVPKSVYDRLLAEQRSFQDKLFESSKKQTRLKEAFEKQISRFNQVIYNLFGYKLEFISSAKLKLVSAKFGSGEFLMVEAKDHQKGVDVQIDTVNYHLDKLDRSVFENLIQYWLVDKHDNSCFLSALNLELFEKQLSTVSS